MNGNSQDFFLHDQNPWDVRDASAFLKYCCPECEFKDDCLEIFESHAVNTHERALPLFGTKQELEDAIKEDPNKYVESQMEGFDDFDSDDNDIKEEADDDDDDYKDDGNDINDDEDDDYEQPKIKEPRRTRKSQKVEEREWPFKVIVDGDGFACAICQETFQLKQRYVSHVIANHITSEDEFEVCQYCVDVFPNYNKLKSHFETVHKDIPLTQYQCNLCDTHFSASIMRLNTHYQQDHKKNQELSLFECSECKKNFVFKEEQLYHETQEHDIKHTFEKCDTCHMDFYSKKMFVIHKYSHGGQESPPPFLCNFCDFFADDKSKIITHHSEEHPRKRPPFFKCDHCDFYHTKENNVKSHSMKEHGEEYFPFKCASCNHLSKGIQTFRNHMDQVHGSGVKLVCDICGHEVSTKRSLKNHIALKHPSPDSHVQVCQYCGFSTKSIITLRRHVDEKHEPDKQKKCDYCEYKTLHRQKLRWHIDSRHPQHGEKKYTCEACGRGFIFKETYLQHVKYLCKMCNYTKRKRKPHHGRGLSAKCDHCDTVLGSTVKIKIHYRDNHPGKPILLPDFPRFICAICDDFFFTKCGLEKHSADVHEIAIKDKNFCKRCKRTYKTMHTCPLDYVKTAGPKKGFNCEYCGATFTQKANYEGHVKTAHEKREDFECEHCGKKWATHLKLKNHIWQAHNAVTCDVCHKQISNPAELKRHKVLVHKDMTGAWRCEHCPKSVFFSQNSYAKHMKIRH